MAQGLLKWDQNELIDEKNWVQKILWDCPFKATIKKYSKSIINYLYKYILFIFLKNV